LFTNLYSTGELSGQLDDTLRRLHDHYQDDASRKLLIVAQWTPRFVYFIVAFGVVYQVFSFWTHYFNQISEFTF